MELRIQINGSLVAGLLQATLSATNYYSADTFTLTFAMGSLPLWGSDLWSALGNAYVEVSNDGDPDALLPIITGRIDMLSMDPILQTVTLEGRDLSAALIDSYLQQDFVNQTAAEVVLTIASQYGLTPNVVAGPGTVGRYFGDGYTKVSTGQFSKLKTNWDLVVSLARSNNFDVYVLGSDLVFQPTSGIIASPIPIGSDNVMSMRLVKNVALSNPQVKVQSWNIQQTAAYRSTSAGATASSEVDATSESATSYLFSQSNLTSAQADSLAEQYSREINRLRMAVQCSMPWDLSISARSLLLLRGTDSFFDGLYQVDSLERHYSTLTGSSQTVHAVAWTSADQETAASL